LCAELSERGRDTDKQEKRERIRESRYIRKYERCMAEDVKVYLGRESAKGRKMMATDEANCLLLQLTLCGDNLRISK
jgi:hypothetical protein